MSSRPGTTMLAALVTDVVEAPGDDDAVYALAGYFKGWSRDELDVLGFVASRLNIGRERYGHLDLASDTRDWRRERMEELADSLVYGACTEIARALRG